MSYVPNVPNLVGLTAAEASLTLAQFTYGVGMVTTAASSTVDSGNIISQTPPAYAAASPGTTVNYVVSTGPVMIPAFLRLLTIISQYSNSPTLVQLVKNMNQYIRQDVNFETFYSFIWSVDTAEGFGLDIWGSIVGISRLLELPSNTNLFGFQNSVTPPGVQPFNFGVFNSPGLNGNYSVLLPDSAYRILILTKALSNISATTAPAINQVLQNLFPGRGNAYVLDQGNMRMQYTFEFQLSLTEFAILSQSGALPHPAGVLVSIVSIPTVTLFGFDEALPNAEPLGYGMFYAA